MKNPHARTGGATTAKYAAVLLAVCLCSSLVSAQQAEASLPAGSLPATGAPVLRFPLAGLYVAGASQNSQSTKPKPAHSNKKLAPMKREKLDPSNVGYIDDPTVQSEVRLRFDAGFNDPRPDLAEYFYAGHAKPVSPTSSFQRTLNFQQLYFNAEYTPGHSFSGFLQIPYRWIQPFFLPSATRTPDLSSASGISDVQLGLKYSAIASDLRTLTLQLSASLPSGDGAAGLGTGHSAIAPAALLYQKLSDRTALEAEFGDSHPIGGTTYFATPTSTAQHFAGDVLMYGAGPSYQLIGRDNFHLAPVLELVGWHVFGGLQTNSANQVQSGAGTNIFNAKLGARLSFSGSNSIYAGYGRGLTSNIWYRNLFRIEIRHSF